MPRFFLYIQYKGSHYHGWQKQPNALTVQQVLEDKIAVLLNRKVETTGAGRTDTGVHAREFVAHFDWDDDLINIKEHFIFKMNCLLPADIAVLDLRMVSVESHARFDAVSRTYEYHLTKAKDPFLTEYAWFYPWPLNLEKLNEACAILKEYNDFTSFSKLHTDVKTNNCIISFAHWGMNGNNIVFTISANRFLRNMVRAIVGTFIEIGKGKINVSDLRQIIEGKNRNFAGTSAPAHGLYLTKIEYPDSLF